MATSTKIIFDLFDVTAKADSTPDFSDARFFCNPQDLKCESRFPQPNYATLEHNHFLLDGSFELFPNNPIGKRFGFWSNEVSDEFGKFKNKPKLPIYFNKPHSSMGLTLYFWQATQDWASQIKIEWFGSSGEKLATGVYYPDSLIFFAEKKVENYYKILITFERTNNPGHIVKLADIKYGVQLIFTGDDVISASIIEEVDMLSNSLRVNTLQVKLFSRTSLFNILNREGFQSVLQHKQRFYVVEEVNGTEVPMGTFYLSDIGNTSPTIAEFKAVSIIGLLDGVPYNGGMYNTDAAQFASELLQGYNYELHPDLQNEHIEGYLPQTTLRRALQEFAFSLSAVIDTSRSDVIRIFPPPSRPSSLIGKNRKFAKNSVKIRPLITGVQVTAHSYKPTTEEVILFDDELPVGRHRISFNEPMHDLYCTPAIIVDSGVNFAVIDVDVEGEVMLVGKGYISVKTIHSYDSENIPANAETNILKVSQATLVSNKTAPRIAKRILSYYENRFEQKFKMKAQDELLADIVIIENDGEKLKAFFEKMEFDLTGGFLVSAIACGKPIEVSYKSFMGEFYSGERGLI